MKPPKESLLITKDLSIKQAMKRISQIGQKVLYVVNDGNKLAGALNDGDIRKWILAGGSIRENVQKCYNPRPKFVDEKYQKKDVRRLMLKYLIESVPVVNNYREVVKILTWDDIFSEREIIRKTPLKVPIVIMAGGKGTRLDPFTTVLPKALIPIGDKPVIEIIMDKFSEYGVAKFIISVNHKSRMIKSYFEDTNDKYHISYIEEKKPLGTAGSLKFLKGKVSDAFLVTNCDIIIDADCGEIVKFHEDNRYDMTLVVSCRHYVIPYGVCEIENGGMLKCINEKPEHDLLVNTGLYVIDSRLLRLIPNNRFFNITDLLEKAKEKGCRIGVFPISEDSWTDIGRWEEYHKAIEKMRIR
jgi:dTDP-glucose pyrophosphorylase